MDLSKRVRLVLERRVDGPAWDAMVEVDKRQLEMGRQFAFCFTFDEWRSMVSHDPDLLVSIHQIGPVFQHEIYSSVVKSLEQTPVHFTDVQDERWGRIGAKFVALTPGQKAHVGSYIDFLYNIKE